MNNTVSIVVAIFNTKRYIDRCIKSLVHQTYKDIQIIFPECQLKRNTMESDRELACQRGLNKLGGVSVAECPAMFLIQRILNLCDIIFREAMQ